MFRPAVAVFVAGFAVFFNSFAIVFAQNQIYLDELDLSKTTCGWNQTAARKTVDNNPLAIAGRRFERGVGHHAPGDILIKLPNLSGVRFSAWVGIDDEVGKRGHAEFLVYGNNKLLWRSEPMVGGQEAKRVDIDLKGLNSLRLHCDTLPEGYGHDHQDWGDAQIEYSGDKKPYTVLVSAGLFDQDGNEFDRMDEAACEWESLTRQIHAGMKDNVKEEALNPAATLLDSDRDPLDIVVRRLPPLVSALQNLNSNLKLDAEIQQIETLAAKSKSVPLSDVSIRKELFGQVLSLRRKIAFQNPLLDFSDVLFIKRDYNPEPEKQGNHMCDQFFGFHGRQGGGLFVLKNAFSDQPEAVPVLDGQTVEQGRYKGRNLDSSWAYLAPELSYDKSEILFCATDATQPRHTYEWTEDNCYHLFRIQFDPKTGRGTHLTQLTDGPYNDIDPCFLPSGRVAFISERRGGYGRCHGRPVPCYTLHSMNPDGTDIVMLSPHETNEWEPDVDHNGMIIYTRWDYVDRGFSQAHHPWITTPDGRDPRIIQGNYDRIQNNRPHFECDIHPVPGSGKLTATATGHHAQHYGSLILIDPQKPDSNQPGQVKRITPDQQFPESEIRVHKDATNYGTCWPLSEEFYLCVYDAFSQSDAGPANNFGIYLLDAFGNRVLLYRDPNISCREAIPVRSRARQTIVPHLTLVGKPLSPGEKFVPQDKSQLPQTAVVGLINVYDSMFPFPNQADGTPARIKRLRVVQLLPKTTPHAHNPAIGYGDQKGARKVLGTVPVESDGSAFFNLPVNVPVYFQALDEKGVAVQTMRSATYVHEGEQLVCQGCHENRHSGMSNRPSGRPLAMRRPASDLVPDPDGTNPFNFVRLVQPVLNDRCVCCHSGAATDLKRDGISESQMRKAAELDLSDKFNGPQPGHFSKSFESLRRYCFFYDNASWTEPQTFPGKFGANRSPLYKTLTSEHFGLKLSPEEMYKLTLWMDNNCDFYGSYDNCPLQRKGEIVPPTLE